MATTNDIDEPEVDWNQFETVDAPKKQQEEPVDWAQFEAFNIPKPLFPDQPSARGQPSSPTPEIPQELAGAMYESAMEKDRKEQLARETSFPYAMKQVARAIPALEADIVRGEFNPLTGESPNVQAALENRPTPYKQELESLRKEHPILSFAGKAYNAGFETVPQMAAVMASGPLAPATAAAVFGYDDEGNFHPDMAAIAAVLPYAGKFGGSAVETVAQKLGIGNESALGLINAGGSYLTANAVLVAQALPGWKDMTPEQRQDAVANILANGTLGLADFHGATSRPGKEAMARRLATQIEQGVKQTTIPPVDLTVAGRTEPYNAPGIHEYQRPTSAFWKAPEGGEAYRREDLQQPPSRPPKPVGAREATEGKVSLEKRLDDPTTFKDKDWTKDAYNYSIDASPEQLKELETLEKKYSDQMASIPKTVENFGEIGAIGKKKQWATEAIRYRKALDEAVSTGAKGDPELAVIAKKYGVGAGRGGDDAAYAKDLREGLAKQEKAVPPAEVPKPSETAVAAPIAQPKIFTNEAADAAKQSLLKKLGRASAGVDPTLLKEVTVIAGNVIEKGAIKFADFAKKMVEEFGDTIIPYLKHAYNQVREYTEAHGLKKNMTPREELDRYDDQGNEVSQITKLGGVPAPGVGGEQAPATSAGGGSTGGRPGIRVVDEGDLPEARPVVRAGQYTGTGGHAIDETQRISINHALTAFEDGKPAFLLGDGTGVGKTGTELVIAAEIAKRTGLPSLIVTQSKPIIENNFKPDSAKFGIPTKSSKGYPGIQYITYDDLSRNKVPKGKFGVVIFDEAHNLKNAGSSRQFRSKQIDSLHTVYATATPMDTVTHAAYFMSNITGKTPQQIADQLGFRFVTRKVDGEDREFVVMKPKVTMLQAVDALKRLRNEAIKKGLMIRREYPFYGNADFSDSRPFNADQRAEQAKIMAYWEHEMELHPRKAFMLSGNRTGEMSRWLEIQKLDETFDNVVKDLEGGKRVVLFAEGINSTKIKGLEGKEIPGFLTEFAKKLDEKGIPYAKVFEDNSTLKAQAARDFQEGKVKVILATPKSGGAGLNMDDVVGDAPRVAHFITMNFAGDVFDQMIGRVSRRNTASPAKIKIWRQTEGFSDQRREKILDRKLKVLRNVQSGEDLDVSQFVESSKSEEASPVTEARAESEPLEIESEQGAAGATPTLQPGSAKPIAIPPKGQRQIITDLRDALNLPVRFGRSKHPRFGGYFSKLANLIVSNRPNDIPTVSHEGGHKLDDMFGLSSDPAIANELNYLGDNNTPGSMSSWTKSKTKKYKMAEGLAEFMRYWLTNPAHAAQKAPNTLKKWNQILDANKDLGDSMRQAQEDIHLWKTAEPQMRLRSHISIGENPNKTRYTISQLTRDLVDDLHYLRLAVDDAKMLTGKELPPSKNPYLLARNLRGSYGMAETFIRNGAVDFASKKVTLGKSLEHALKPVSGRINDFRDWIVAKRAQELENQGRRTGLVRSDINTVVQKYDKDPAFQEAFQKVKDWNDAILQYAVDSGLVTEESAQNMRDMNLDYVPFHRIFEIGAGEFPSEQSIGVGRGLNVGTPGSLKALRGSRRDIVDPLETMVKNAYSIVTASEKAAINVAVANMSGMKGMGKWIERIGTPKELHKIPLERIKSQLERAGADLKKVNPALLLNFYQMARQVPFGENIIRINRGGRSEFYRLNRELYDTFKALDLEDTGKLIRILSAPAQLLRAGVVLEPSFNIANALRDTLSAAVISKYGALPFETTAKGVFALLKNPQMVADWAASGGKSSVEASFFDRRKMQEFIREHITKDMTRGERALAWAKSPLTFLRFLTGTVEEATRIGEFQIAKKELLKGGMSEGEANRMAAFEARDRQDFAKGGAKTKIIRHLAAFWNAQLQAQVKLAQSFKRRPIRTIMQGLAFITIPKMIEQALNWNDQDYWDRPQWERDLFFLIPAGKGKDGHTRFIRLPTPFEPGVIFGTFPGRIMQWVKTHKPDAAKSFPGFMIGQSVPNPIPQTMQVIFEDFLSGPKGWDVWRGRQIVPESLADLPPELQWTEQTSALAKKVGAQMKFSPIKIDHIIDSTTGGMGKLLTGRQIPGQRFATLPLAVNNQPVQDFYDTLGLMRQEAARIRKERHGVPPRFLSDFEASAREMSALRNDERRTTDPQQKLRLQNQMLELARRQMHRLDAAHQRP